MLVTITIIGILAGLVFGALAMARASAREAATKATIAKLDGIIMARYESYRNRRLPIGSLVYPSGHTKAGQPLSPHDAAQDRLYALRDIMRMEMPDRISDIPTAVGASDANDGTGDPKKLYDPPIVLPNSGQRVTIPALGMLYHSRLVNTPPKSTSGLNGAAELLFMIVSMGSPEVLEQFSQSEIGDTDHNGYPEFLDGWGRPIFFLRWAPGFSSFSGVQSGNANTDHDPFDTRNVESTAFHLIPLIYSSGTYNDPGLVIKEDYHFGNKGAPGSMFSGSQATIFSQIGAPKANMGRGNITNHHMDQR